MKRIVMMGDEVCSDYCPVLAALLKEDAELWLAPKPVATSVDHLVGVGEWVLPRQPEVAVFASGILDTRKICFGENERLVPLTAFARNVRCILKMVLEQSTSTPVWITMPPVDVRHVKSESEFGYDNETISLYNEEAKAVARMLGVAVIDLYGIVKAASRADSYRPEGVRFDGRGSDYNANAIAVRLREICAKA
ncbi:hypothetical protein IEN85_20210 [Pelagicoccus sp. NFK12]|uniref:Uncharacterized protein n=1 Tax=Pelagicoccus enzymogenes TaxID=2773457 RepID=A0A927FDL1_9BACT|nr:hypothetical protein [Pelagicoccus enzymogenes]MBD5781836.1 hypothetical protein [Pelagicoccus enzymogenes]MDQ8196592.1 hypothetical protein [Pelagicoccus enzymogenes]